MTTKKAQREGRAACVHLLYLSNGQLLPLMGDVRARPRIDNQNYLPFLDGFLEVKAAWHQGILNGIGDALDGLRTAHVGQKGERR